MRFLGRTLIALVVNTAVLIAIGKFVPNVTLTDDLWKVIVLGAILTLLNFIVKPVLRLFLSPVILITLGIGLILVNAIILYVLDNISGEITIHGVAAYLYAAILLGIANLLSHIFLIKK